MTLQKLVANVRERFRATTSKSGSTLTLLTENIIYSIGKLLTISSRDAHFANQDKPLQKMVCSNIIKFYLWKNNPYPEGDLAKCKNAADLLSRVFEQSPQHNFANTSAFLTLWLPVYHQSFKDWKHFQRNVTLPNLSVSKKREKIFANDLWIT